MNPVQQKIPCVYTIGVSNETSAKRKQQTFKVTATKDLNSNAESDGISTATPTEKLDGTCCFINEFQGKPCLWARHDRKPNKAGEKRFALYKTNKQKDLDKGDLLDTADFTWNVHTEFKEVPAHWIPASRLEVVDGVVVPDKQGHTPGWVPVESKSRQHCWHLSSVRLEDGLALTLRECDDNSEELLVEIVPLSTLSGQTCELVGTNINGNPYNIGSKKQPLHFLVPHGSISVACPSPLDRDALSAWLQDGANSRLEGVVWHCPNGNLYKLHRHHMDLPWPVAAPRLSCRRVRVQAPPLSDSDDAADTFTLLTSLDGQTFETLADLHSAMFSDAP